jgi:hypothetical protein
MKATTSITSDRRLIGERTAIAIRVPSARRSSGGSFAASRRPDQGRGHTGRRGEQRHLKRRHVQHKHRPERQRTSRTSPLTS